VLTRVLSSPAQLPGNFVSIVERIFKGLAPFKREDDPGTWTWRRVVASLILCQDENVVMMMKKVELLLLGAEILVLGMNFS